MVLFLVHVPGWYGLRVTDKCYVVLRDLREHPPLFSERYGYRPFHQWLRIGNWQLGWKN